MSIQPPEIFIFNVIPEFYVIPTRKLYFIIRIYFKILKTLTKNFSFKVKKNIVGKNNGNNIVILYSLYEIVKK